MKKIVIVGGGFAGLQSAVELARRVDTDVSITLIAPKDYFEYYPGFYRILHGVSPVEIAIPFTRILPPNITVVTDTVIKVDSGMFTVHCASGTTYGFDYLVLAPGSEPIVCTVPGVCEYAYSFRSVSHVLKIRARFQELVKRLSSGEIPEVSVMIVGGGATGIEASGALITELDNLARQYAFDRKKVRINILHGGDRLMQQVAPPFSAKILKRLQRLGVTVHLSTTLTEQTYDTVITNTMTARADIVIWTAGAVPSSLLQNVHGAVLNERGRVFVGQYMEVSEYPYVFVIGDCAVTPYSGLAQTAFYDGAYIAKHITRLIHNQTPIVYKPKQNAFILPIGSWWGIFIKGNIWFTGIVAYLGRIVADILYFTNLMGIKNTYEIFRDGRRYQVDDCTYEEVKE